MAQTGTGKKELQPAFVERAICVQFSNSWRQLTLASAGIRFTTWATRFFKSYTDVPFMEFTWSFICTQKKKSMGIKQGHFGANALVPPVAVHLLWKFLSESFRTIIIDCGRATHNINRASRVFISYC
jgi:hypothetical protein